MVAQRADSRTRSVELTFEVRDPALFFVRGSRVADCRVTLAEMVHRSDGRLLEYFVVEGADRDTIRAAADDAAAIDEVRVIRESDDELLAEFVVSGPCIGGTLATAGAVIRVIEAMGGVGRVVADVPPHADVSEVVEAVGERHDAALLSRQDRDQPAPAFTRQEFRDALAERLTDRQFEALRTAFVGGYFSWPRESTAEECARALGITQPTFTEHLRAGEAKLLAAMFDEESGAGQADAGTTGPSPRRR